MPVIVPLDQVDPADVERLLDAAFGPGRHGRTAYRLRNGAAWLPALSFAACDGPAPIATIQCWPIALTTADGAERAIVLVGPVAVSPDRQRDGIGRRLMARMLDEAGATADLVLIGDPEYYGRFFGFSAEATAGWTVPGPVERHRLLARLAPGVAWPARGVLGPPATLPATTG